ncbi:MAG: type II secretion system F family protein [Bacillota bacterium]
MQFAYRARETTGKMVTGMLEADTQAAAVEVLRRQNRMVIDLKPKQASRNVSMNVQFGQPKVTGRDLAIFCRQFSTLVNAGVNLMLCLSILEQQAEKKPLKEAIGAVMQSLREGSSLTDALAQHPKVFSQMFIYMVEAGETGGVLDEIMERLAQHLEKEYELNEKIKSAMTYPMVLAIVALLSITFMLTFILPKFAEMLTSLGTELPMLTKIVMGLSNAVRQYWYLIFGTLGGAFYGLRHYLQTEKGSMAKDQFVLRMPVFGMLNKKVIVSRFTRTLGTLLRGGVPILLALSVVKKTTGNKLASIGIATAEEHILNGRSMAPALELCGVFPPMVTRMISIGEETGTLDNLLEKIGTFYDQEVDVMVGKLASMLEPIMLVALAAVVGFMILAMMLPIFSLMSGSGAG